MNSISTIQVPRSFNRILLVLMGIGVLSVAAGLAVDPERIWANYLICLFLLIGIGLGGAFFVAIQYVSNSGWAVAIRRIPESLSVLLIWAAVGTAFLFPGIHSLYEWSHPEVVAADPILLAKSGWLNVPFFMARLGVYFLIWIGFSRWLVRLSLRQDETGDVTCTSRNVRTSAIFLIVGTFAFCLATVDLLMSLQPHWYSTVFAWLTLSGMFLSGLATITVFLVTLRSFGYQRYFTTDHLHDMGRLMMSFSVFWVYMWVSQHMLIWYSNIPEETSYYIFRHFGGWGSLSFLNVILNWLIPFLVLLPRSSKRNDKIMLQMAVVILVGRWLDLYIMVMPPRMGAEPSYGLWEIAPFVGSLALILWVGFRNLQRHPPVPLRDPYLVESLPEAVSPGHDAIGLSMHKRSES